MKIKIRKFGELTITWKRNLSKTREWEELNEEFRQVIHKMMTLERDEVKN